MRITIYSTGPVDFISRVLIIFGAPVLGFISGGYISSCIAEMFGWQRRGGVLCAAYSSFYRPLYLSWGKT